MQATKENKHRSVNGNFNRQLKSYSALAGATLAMTPALDAQIIYTDIDPDSTVFHSDAPFDLDINNDGSPDFSISASRVYDADNSNYQYRYLSITPAPGNFVATAPALFDICVSYGYAPAADTIPENSLISANLSWTSNQPWAPAVRMGYSAHTSWFCSIYFGPWQQLTDSYLGLRFQIGSQQHYGWARLDVDIVFPYFTIKDYAYEATPNTSILAGAGIPTTICNVPTGLSTINVLPNKAKLTWGSVANATKYKVYYKEIGSPGGPQSKNSIDNIRIINNLNPSTTYTAKVKAWCPGIGWSEVSAPITFTTPVMREGELDEGSLGAEIYSFHKNIYLQIHDWQDKITAQVAVFDMLGKRIYQSQINQQNEVIDLHSQPNGVYVVVLRVGGLVVKRRVFIGIRD